MSERDPVRLRDAATAIARDAGAIVRAGYGRIHAPERKGRIDLVTDYDRRSEALIVEALRRRFPDHALLAEESGAHAAAGGVRWLVDPLDGTTNFSHNYPFFAVSIAAEVDGALAAGVVFDPVRDELFAAARGAGATLNDAPLHVSAIARLEDALLVTGFPYDVREYPERSLPLFQAFLMRAQGIRRDGSAALNLAYLAAGRFDGFWEERLHPWDMAAAMLIVEEAGGRVSNYSDQPIELFVGQIVASNGHIHTGMIDVIQRATSPPGR